MPELVEFARTTRTRELAGTHRICSVSAQEGPPAVALSPRIDEFKRHILPAKSVLIVAHDYPDPDCLAAASGLSLLLNHWGSQSTLITFGGFVGRAENRAMIRFLNIETLPVALVHKEDFDRIVVVDAIPGGGNLSLPRNAKVDAVFDHHMDEPGCGVASFCEVRKDIGATSTIVTKYLVAAGVPIPPDLATALFYGIKTDTGDMGRDVSSDDIDCYKLLFDLMDHQRLALIENPDRDVKFYRTIHEATGSAVCYGTVGYTHLGTVSSPDYIAEMADFFQSLEKLEWMVCSGVFKRSLFFSLRTKKHADAGQRAHAIGHALGGNGGGHGRIAAGRIALGSQPKELTVARFVQTFKDVFRIADEPEEKMVD